MAVIKESYPFQIFISLTPVVLPEYSSFKNKVSACKNVDVYILCFLHHPTLSPNHKVTNSSEIQVAGYH